MSPITAPELATIQTRLRSAMSALDACGQSDLVEILSGVFETVAGRTFFEPEAAS